MEAEESIMQKTVNRFVRLLFVAATFFLIVGIFLTEIVVLNENPSAEMIIRGQADNNSVVVAANKEPPGSDEKIESSVVGEDARPLLIRKYLEKYKSPLAPYSDLIFSLSETYGFDYYWMVAIAQQESNLCKKIPEDSHNCWGYGIHKSGTLRFDNYELALKSYAEYLKRVYFDKGLNTPELIMKKYCPSSNGSWAKGVRQFIEEIESGAG